MSALKFQTSTGETGVTSTARTLLTHTAPANQRVKVTGLSFFGKGTSNTDSPIKIELLTYTALAGGTANTIVVSKRDGDCGETVQTQCAGNYGTTSTPAEPTYTAPVTIETWELHPQAGFSNFFPSDAPIILKGGTGLAVRLTSVQNETVAVNVYLEE